MRCFVSGCSVLMVAAVLAAGCGGSGRDTSTLPASLIGHWVTESGATHYYFDGAFVVMVDEGDPTDLGYAVLDVDEPGNTMMIAVGAQNERATERLLEFSAGRDSLVETLIIGDFRHSTPWVYVDGLTEPAAR